MLKVTGKVGNKAKYSFPNTALRSLKTTRWSSCPGTYTPESLTGRWSVYGDDKFDYVQLGLSARLPYQSFQLTDPAKVVVDVFGATNNTNWITQLENTQEIKMFRTNRSKMKCSA